MVGHSNKEKKNIIFVLVVSQLYASLDCQYSIVVRQSNLLIAYETLL